MHTHHKLNHLMHNDERMCTELKGIKALCSVPRILRQIKVAQHIMIGIERKLCNSKFLDFFLKKLQTFILDVHVCKRVRIEFNMYVKRRQGRKLIFWYFFFIFNALRLRLKSWCSHIKQFSIAETENNIFTLFFCCYFCCSSESLVKFTILVNIQHILEAMHREMSE